jgi:hypothetical protein
MDLESCGLKIMKIFCHVLRIHYFHCVQSVNKLFLKAFCMYFAHQIFHKASFKVKNHINTCRIFIELLPFLGFRPDHPKERSGPVVYIYDAMYVNVSTTPVEDPLYRLIPRSKWYEPRHDKTNIMSFRPAWTKTSLRIRIHAVRCQFLYLL